MTKPYRIKFTDPDNRPRPKTNEYCCICNRDLKPAQKRRFVHLVDGGPFALHPEDETLYPKNDPGDLLFHAVGADCAKKLGLEWSIQG